MTDRQVRRAGPGDLDALATLFDAYRQFYGLAPDLPLSRRFLEERLRNRDSVILVAEGPDGGLLGFAQLYPTLCSLAAARIFVLYDLWVEPGARLAGTGRALMGAAGDHARAAGAVRLELMTARTNVPAQRLYESLGWVRDQSFYSYNLRLAGSPPSPDDELPGPAGGRRRR